MSRTQETVEEKDQTLNTRVDFVFVKGESKLHTEQHVRYQFLSKVFFTTILCVQGFFSQLSTFHAVVDLRVVSR